MRRVRLTKDELKRQRDGLDRFLKYLPMLELKRRQLQVEIDRIEAEARQLREAMADAEAAVSPWAGVFAEPVDLFDFFRVREIHTTADNVAGVVIPVLEEVSFEDTEYDLGQTPLWVDAGIQACKQQLERTAGLRVAEEQLRLLREELRFTIQRLNLFDKVKIPEAREAIRAIQIFLGDQQTVAVVRGKMAKASIDRQNRRRVRT